MRLTRANLERLCKNCGYNPERIGIAVLRTLGYKVDTYVYSDAVYVGDKRTGRIVYAYSGGDR